jgi:hypothetical protein
MRQRAERVAWFIGVCVVAACAADAPRASSQPSEDVLRVDGSCAAAHSIDAEGIAATTPARPVGDVARYRVPLWLTEERVRVRANAMWDGADLRNVIGTARGGRWVLGEGPLRDAELGAGIGYAVVVEDPSGQRCRGYVSITVVRPSAGPR